MSPKAGHCLGMNFVDAEFLGTRLAHAFVAANVNKPISAKFIGGGLHSGV